MQIISSVLIAIGLAMDAFAVSMGVGTTEHSSKRRARIRLAFHFGVFQMGMAILGWAAGSTISGSLQRFDHWIAFCLLAYVGVMMIRSGSNSNGSSYCTDPCSGRLMMVLCVATSIDALAVGLSMAMINAPIVAPSITIGVITFALSLLGLSAGSRLGQKFGKRMEVFGGLLLNGIGLQILLTHLF
ncbi:MAG: manganese efflux pump [Anaerolineaceae bacterium]|nr:manganese efflux pump [Anaerolineaceae bacterium]